MKFFETALVALCLSGYLLGKGWQVYFLTKNTIFAKTNFTTSMARISIKIITCFCLASILWSCQQKNTGSEQPDFHQQSLENSTEPLRPGKPGKRPFWNKFARQFQFAPAFNFQRLENATQYRFKAKSQVNNKNYQFTADVPWQPLSPIWQKLPVGYFNLTVEGLNKNDQPISTAGQKEIYKAPVFPGADLQDTSNYRGAAKRLLKALYNLDHIQNWAENGTPDHENYTRYCYPSKMEGAVIWSMLDYVKTFPGENQRALKIAQKAADYLIAQSEPEGAPMEYFPPTYEGDAITADEYAGQLMMVYPAEVGMHYLELHEVTGNEKYLNAAIRIADTYKKTQLSNGTWYLKVYADTGNPVHDTYLIPSRILVFLDQLISEYGKTTYQQVNQKALQWTMENPMKTFKWTGQFEDVDEFTPYKNLSHIEPAWMVVYLLNHLEGNREKYLSLSRELLRFCEDQFVIWGWERPYKVQRDLSDDFAPNTWIIPAALEQYNFYVPITTSACRIIRAWNKMYQVTGEKIYLAKSIRLANSMLNAQNQQSGHVSTYWSKERVKNPTANYWLNNSAFFSEIMLQMDQVITKSNYFD